MPLFASSEKKVSASWWVPSDFPGVYHALFFYVAAGGHLGYYGAGISCCVSHGGFAVSPPEECWEYLKKKLGGLHQDYLSDER